MKRKNKKPKIGICPNCQSELVISKSKIRCTMCDYESLLTKSKTKDLSKIKK